jgi:hypothetical protein
VALVRKRNVPTKRPPLVGEVSANVSSTDPHGRILAFLGRTKKITFRKLDLFLSSGEGKDTYTLLGPLERINLIRWSLVEYIIYK